MNNANNIHYLYKEKKRIEERIKFLEKENNLTIEKLEELKNRRNSMKYQHEKELGIIENNKKLRLKKFIEDLNNKGKNELLEEKIKKLQENSKKIQLKMQEDLKVANDKKNYEIDRMKKENEEKIKKYIKDMKEKELEDIKKRNNNAKEQVLKLKKLMNKGPRVKTPLYPKKENIYIEKEANLIKNENKRRKEYMKHISLKEFDEFAKNYNEIKSKQLYESNLKIEKEKENWSKRYKLIPEYVNPLSKLILQEEKSSKKAEEERNIQRKKNQDRQRNYKAPKPIKIIKDNQKNNVNEVKVRKPLLKSSSYSDILRQKMKIKFNTTKNKKEKKEEENNKNSNYNIINFKLPLISIKEKNNKLNKSFDKKQNNNQKHELITDYLKQQRQINEKNREKKRNIGELSKLDYIQTNDIKKLIKENGLDENLLKVAKSKLETVDEKKKQKSLLLKLNGGIANIPELGEEICDLMIDSIQARLSIIQEIENLDERNNDNNKTHNDENEEELNEE